ncbi:unnamed protein product [Sphagnum balticum]
MYALFDANIDIEGRGGISAAPDRNTPGGSYFYHWMRDAGLSMRIYMELNNFQLSAIEKKLKSYVNWVTKDNKANIPGILLGRYPGDSYAGGNPWQLLTAVLAKAFYQGANLVMESKGFLKEEDKEAWFNLLKIPQSASLEDQVRASISAGDSVLYRLYQHVKNDGGHIDEQIGRNSGTQTSAKDLTWSFANVMSAMKEREKAQTKL